MGQSLDAYAVLANADVAVLASGGFVQFTGFGKSQPTVPTFASAWDVGIDAPHG